MNQSTNSIADQATGIALKDYQSTSMNSSQIFDRSFVSSQNQPASPHKLSKGTKFRRYEEEKEEMNGDYSPMKTFNESFSPNKGYGIRVSLGQKGSFTG